jgi:hypothetical protein
MNNRKILLINLSQGKVGEENMALLGGMLITRIYSTTVRRVEIDPRKRIPFNLYVDEFQNFATSTFTKILSEARKFGLGLTITHQFIDQIEESIQNAIFGNIGTMMNFAVGPRDAESLVKEYTPYLTAEDLVNQEKFGLVIKLSIDFKQSKPFTAKTLPSQYPETHLREKAIEISRETYSKPKELMEQKIYKWAAQSYDDKGNLMQTLRDPNAPLSDVPENVPVTKPVAPPTPKPSIVSSVGAAVKQMLPKTNPAPKAVATTSSPKPTATPTVIEKPKVIEPEPTAEVADQTSVVTSIQPAMKVSDPEIPAAKIIPAVVAPPPLAMPAQVQQPVIASIIDQDGSADSEFKKKKRKKKKKRPTDGGTDMPVTEQPKSQPEQTSSPIVSPKPITMSQQPPAAPKPVTPVIVAQAPQLPAAPSPAAAPQQSNDNATYDPLPAATEQITPGPAID